MSKKEVIENMMIELDYLVKEYDSYNDPELKESIALEFKHTVYAYNALLRTMYKKISGPTFRRKIEKYKDDREWRYAE